MITLLGPRAAPIVEKVARGLALKQLSFTSREPRSTADYWRWSPETGRLPVIDIDGERLHDSTAILLRIEELHPDPPFFSSEPRIAFAQRRMVNWADETYVWYWKRWQQIRPEGPPSEAPVSGAVFAAGPGESATRAELARPVATSLREWIAIRLQRQSGSRQSDQTRLVEEIGARVNDMARLLADRPFYYSQRISMADLSVYAMLRSLIQDSIPGVKQHLERHPQLLEFTKRVEQATGG